jgi:multidrug resistance efflux pump
MKNVRIITGYILVGLIVIFTVIAILGIWNIINFEDVVNNALKSFLVVFVASAVVLFITTVLIKDDEPKNPIG